MRLRVVCFLAIVILIAACQGPPPTQIVMVVTATPAESIPTQTPYVIVVTATQQVEATETLAPDVTLTQMPAQSPFTPVPVLNAYPTNTFSPVQVAEQIFEGGRMFWLEPNRQIWVIVESGDLLGRWFVYNDSFQEGEAEFDATIMPPEGYLQPIRGFGKIWRDNTEIREALGWATANELGYVSNYEYHPGGTLTSRGLYEPGPGYHILYTQTNQAIRFNEGPEGPATWQFIQTDATPTVTP
jgi:hypothetical protein